MRRLIIVFIIGNLSFCCLCAYPIWRDTRAETEKLAIRNPAYYQRVIDEIRLTQFWSFAWLSTTLLVLPTIFAAITIAAIHSWHPREFLRRQSASWIKYVLLVVIIMALSIVASTGADVLISKQFPVFSYSDRSVYQQWLLYPIVFALITGLLMLFSRRMRPGRCSQCNYDIAHSIAFGRCPECGTSIMSLK